MSRASDASVPSGRLPNFLIIGAAKAGTTSLFQVLRRHPQVFMPYDKELEFFDRRFSHGLDWYRRQFAGAGEAVAVGEATPYMSDAAAIDRIASTLPDVRLVALLRNPVDRAYSHYWHMRGHNAEPRSFEDAVEAEQRGNANVPPYLAGGQYARQLETVLERFGRERLLVLLFEEYREDPLRTFTEVARFLGIDSTCVPPNLGERYNEARRYRSVKFRMWQRKYQQRLRIPPRLGALMSRLNTVRTPYPPMSSELRARLTEWFAEDNRALAALLGRDLGRWG